MTISGARGQDDQAPTLFVGCQMLSGHVKSGPSNQRVFLTSSVITRSLQAYARRPQSRASCTFVQPSASREKTGGRDDHLQESVGCHWSELKSLRSAIGWALSRKTSTMPSAAPCHLHLGPLLQPQNHQGGRRPACEHGPEEPRLPRDDV